MKVVIQKLKIPLAYNEIYVEYKLLGTFYRTRIYKDPNGHEKE